VRQIIKSQINKYSRYQENRRFRAMNVVADGSRNLFVLENGLKEASRKNSQSCQLSPTMPSP
jgi:hypothetical protein